MSMIVSHSHKFIFIKIPKTAGESLVNILQPYCDMELWNPNIGNHEWYSEIVGKHSRFKNYFKFAFVRNPWELKLSRFFYIKDKEHGSITSKSFAEWVCSGSPYRVLVKKGQFAGKWRVVQDWYPNLQLSWICESATDRSWEPDGKKDTSMNFIGRFENLQQDFNIVCDKIGIPKQKLPHKNATKHKHYTEYYDDETKEIVAEKYAKDIEYFDYKFGE